MNTKPNTSLIYMLSFLSGLWAGIADFLILGAAWLLTGFSGFVHHAGIFITLSAVVRGLIFPLVHHVGTDGNKSGR